MVKPLLKWLNVVGCNPYNISKSAIIRWFFWSFYTFIFILFIFIRTVNSLQTGITLESVENVLNFFLLFQFISKYLFYRVKAKVLEKLFIITYENFWPTDFVLEGSEKFNFMYYILFKIMDIYRKSYIVMNALYTIEPLFYRKGLIRIPIWLPNYDEIIKRSPYYEMIYIFEASITLSADFVMLNFELMCLYFLGTCYVQIEMIKTRFLQIGNDSFTQEDFTECVKHHHLILNHLNCIVSTLSLTMLQQVVTYFMAICLPAFLFTSTGDVSIGFCICSVINLINFYLYCLIGQHLYDQCLSISDSISNSNWWKSDKNLRRSLLIVMERSSKGIKLTAGGLLDLTLSTFLEVLKLLLSTLQFLWSTNNRSSIND